MTNLLKTFGRQLAVGFAVLAALTVLLGVAYPAGVWLVSRIDSHAAEGDQLTDAKGCGVGSALIGVDPKPAAGQPDWYLHSRVAGTADDAMAAGDPASSAASNLGPNNPDLQTRIELRRSYIAARDGVAPSAVPVDAVTGSGSGLDPDISAAYANLQVARIAREGRLPESKVRQILDDNTTGRQWGFLGQPRVNVMRVNLALGHVAAVCHT
ncbi:potassium-transporting ATPase C chain [Gordonia effusa NBRC 100432]|uniref:Potassium-transporting ATPase KdpC subunit n=1 Tax=Gordonia effusa NBRC 100432 TaxID=1077974 RepID=H0QXS5_9ACTN|nr:potassium-transporting ATPase subunit C [Gordonia effusa]GAB17626.1 potassium-transporting ATPase C chain [Gordonia effusa NBRC 100432]